MSVQKYKIDPFYALADPSRREILLMLGKERRTISTLASRFDVSRPAVSKHIKVLYDAGFIDIEDVGRERYCALKSDGFDLVKDWVGHFEQFWQVRMKNLENLLNERSLKKNKK